MISVTPPKMTGSNSSRDVMQLTWSSDRGATIVLPASSLNKTGLWRKEPWMQDLTVQHSKSAHFTVKRLAPDLKGNKPAVERHHLYIRAHAGYEILSYLCKHWCVY